MGSTFLSSDLYPFPRRSVHLRSRKVYQITCYVRAYLRPTLRCIWTSKYIIPRILSKRRPNNSLGSREVPRPSDPPPRANTTIDNNISRIAGEFIPIVL
ncbi:hypothetical protein BDZ94DRAFT_1273366 [Collybia nuda]|uniref:Uncharacterized protein n=1 Tax=Collybia nuda TaxID=64659 RepID=A0A9P6CCQ3_9AGAR|nr:hypothetical protein BDZ94DRAFT_1273366 [Collybia nuda]